MAALEILFLPIPRAPVSFLLVPVPFFDFWQLSLVRFLLLFVVSGSSLFKRTLLMIHQKFININCRAQDVFLIKSYWICMGFHPLYCDTRNIFMVVNSGIERGMTGNQNLSTRPRCRHTAVKTRHACAVPVKMSLDNLNMRHF